VVMRHRLADEFHGVWRGLARVARKMPRLREA
jgi:hypothetical protein